MKPCVGELLNFCQATPSPTKLRERTTFFDQDHAKLRVFSLAHVCTLHRLPPFTTAATQQRPVLQQTNLLISDGLIHWLLLPRGAVTTRPLGHSLLDWPIIAKLMLQGQTGGVLRRTDW